MLRHLAEHCGIAAVVFAGQVAAQDNGRVAVSIGLPAALGLTIHLSESVALRPDLSFTYNRFDRENGEDTSTWVLGTGLSALFFGPSADNLRHYFAPRLSYQRPSGGGVPTYGLSASYGAKYSASRRFAVSGELGLAYLRTSQESFGTSSTLGLRSGIGVLVYLR